MSIRCWRCATLYVLSVGRRNGQRSKHASENKDRSNWKRLNPPSSLEQMLCYSSSKKNLKQILSLPICHRLNKKQSQILGEISSMARLCINGKTFSRNFKPHPPANDLEVTALVTFSCEDLLKSRRQILYSDL